MNNQGKRRVATVGTFDGLHLGHRKVIAMVREEAAVRSMDPMVVCFDRHPLETVAPERAPMLLQSPAERSATLGSEGLSLLVLEFNAAMAAMTAGEWMRKMHLEHGVDVLVVGYDNTFGSDGTAMKISDYKAIGREVGVEVLEAPYVPRAASSAIRKLVAEGNLDEAAQLLGRTYSVTGTVVPGKQLGRRLGYPTANVQPSYRAQLPLDGVYAVQVVLPDGRSRRAVANIGVQPTVASDASRRLEVHLPGFDGDLYGKDLTVKFLRRLRDEVKFSSPDELKRQIQTDIRHALTEN